MTLYGYSGARTLPNLGAYIKHPKKRKFYTAIVRAQNWIKTGTTARGRERAGRWRGSALQSWQCGRAWGDGTRDLTGINYDTGSRTSAGAYGGRMTWDSDGRPANACARIRASVGLVLHHVGQCCNVKAGACSGQIKLTSNSVETFRAKDLPQLTQWQCLDAGEVNIGCSHSWSQSCTHYVNSNDVAIVVARQSLRSEASPGKAH